MPRHRPETDGLSERSRSRIRSNRPKADDTSHFGSIGTMVRVGVMAVLVFSPLAFGAVHTWAYGIVWGVLWLLVALWIARGWLTGSRAKDGWEVNWIKTPFQVSMMLFGIWVLVQVLPLPVSWVGWFQPNSLKVHLLAKPVVGEAPAVLPLSQYLHATHVGIFHLWSYAALFFLTLYHLKTRKHLLVMAILWVALGTFEAIYGLMEYLGGTHRIWWWTNPFSGGVHGTFINKNHLAGYLEMTVLVAIGLFLAMREGGEAVKLSWRGRLSRLAREDSWAKSLLLYFVCLLMGTALLLSLSRAAVLTATLLLLPIAIFLALKKTTRWYGILSLTFFFGMILYTAPLGLDTLLERFSALGEDMGSRKALWRSTLEMSRAYPLAGSGWGTYEWVYPQFKAVQIGERVVTHAHNDWLELWAETGIVGLILVLSGVCLYLLGGLRVLGKRRDRWAIWLGFGALAAVVVVGAHSLVEFHLRTPANALTLAALMAWGWVVLHHHRRGHNRESRRWQTQRILIPSWLGHAGMVLLACVHLGVGVGMARHLLAEFMVSTKRNSTIVATEVRDLDRLRMAIDLEPANARRWAWMAREALRQGFPPHLGRWARQKGLESEPDGGAAALWARALLQRAIRLNPTSAYLYQGIGWLLASHPEWEQSEGGEYALRRAVRLEPNNGLRHLHLGQYLMEDGRPDEARDAFRKAVNLTPRLRSHVESVWGRDLEKS